MEQVTGQARAIHSKVLILVQWQGVVQCLGKKNSHLRKRSGTMNSDTFWKQEGHLKNEVKTVCTERDGGLKTMERTKGT